MDHITDAELEAIRRRCAAATPGPWRSLVEGRDHTSGDSFIMIGTEGNRRGDMYITIDSQPASPDDLDFIAGARQDVERLLEEIERLTR